MNSLIVYFKGGFKTRYDVLKKMGWEKIKLRPMIKTKGKLRSLPSGCYAPENAFVHEIENAADLYREMKMIMSGVDFLEE